MKKPTGVAMDDGTTVGDGEGPERTVQHTKGIRSERQQRRHQNAKAMRAAKGGRLAGIKAACKMRR